MFLTVYTCTQVVKNSTTFMVYNNTHSCLLLKKTSFPSKFLRGIKNIMDGKSLLSMTLK